MLHSIALLLWALLSWFAPHSPAAPYVSIRHPYVAGDSTIFQQLQIKLANRQALERPEKMYLQVDRTLFRPGDTLWFNAYLRNASDLMPAFSQIMYVELLDPRGSVLQKLNLLAPDGLAAGEFTFPTTLPGGLYKIQAYTNWMKNTDTRFEREITLQKVVLPNLNLKLEFERKAYGPGDQVEAKFDVLGLDNKPLEHKSLRFSVAVDGKTMLQNSTETDVTGRAQVRFQLPEDLASNDGLLNITLENNGQTEAISRAIPIVLNKIDLQFFPEGGDAIAGIPARIGFKALNEFGKPADVEGTIFNEKAEKVGSFSSYHDGMGAFELLPEAGKRYYAELTKPFQTGKTAQRFDLPTIREEGYALRLQARDAGGLVFAITGATPGTAHLIGTSQDKIFFFKTLQVDQKGKTIRVETKNLPIGIARFTLFDGQKNAQAERLVFVNRDHGLKVDIHPNKNQFLPREEVILDIKVHDHIGRPVKGNFSLAVVDEKLLSYADNKQGHLLSSLLLEQDVKGKIEEPNFYFDDTEPKSEQAMDYLLMTQGWRRFEWKRVGEGNPPAYANTLERMEIAGRVIHRNGEPWAGQMVQLYPNGPKTHSDNNGFFTFRKADLSKYTSILYGKNQQYRIREFRHHIELTPNESIKYATKPRMYYAKKQPESNPDNQIPILTGTVSDKDGEVLIGATIKVYQGKKRIKSTITDFNGEYRVPLAYGKFDVVVSYTGYFEKEIKGIHIVSYLTPLDIEMEGNAILYEVVVTDKNFTSPLTIQGVRSNGTSYYIDGIRVQGAPPPMPNIKEEESMIAPEMTVSFDKLSRRPQENEISVNGYANVRSMDLAKRRYNDDTLGDDAGIIYNGQNAMYHRARSFYSPNYKNNQTPIERSDFRPTLYWNPSVQTNAYGSAQVRFYTNDAISNFRATLEGIGNAGQPAHQETRFFAQKPFDLVVKMPESVIAGDTLMLKVVLNNHTFQSLSGNLKVEVPRHFEAITQQAAELNTEHPYLQMAAQSNSSVVLKYVIRHDTLFPGEMQPLTLTFVASNGQSDAVTQSIRSYERGYPVKQVLTGANPQNHWQLQLNTPVEGSVQAKLTVYTSALNEVLKGMERMLRQPNGCFEQVSSSNYPNLLVLDLMKSTGKLQPDIEQRAMDLLKDGYQKLVAYECKNGGFDWWGRDPAHEGLTAYGILEFTDMSKVFQVDQQLITRSVEWLKKRRDGKGGWVRREDWHGWQSDGVIGAYIAWSLAEAGYAAAFKPEIESSYEEALKTEDAYQLALMTNAFILLKDPRAQKLIDALLKKQEEKGSWIGNSHSVMSSSGECFRIETTALAVLALMKNGKSAGALQKGMQFILAAKNEYGYGSTQSTVLALKALVAYAKNQQAQAENGVMVVQIDGKRVLEQAFSSEIPKNIEITGLQQYFSNDHPFVEVFFEKMTKAPAFDIEIQYAARQPRNSPNCLLQFATSLDQKMASVGQTVRLRASMKNNSNAAMASPMMVIGIPAGLSLQPWQLKKLVDEKQCDFYELWDGFAVFHFERLPANVSKELALDLRVDIAGTYEAPASQAFLYYDNDQRVWSKPDRIKLVY